MSRSRIFGVRLASVFWIRVEDEMPDDDMTVLIAMENADDPVWLGFHDNDCWRCVDASSVSDKVTHWAHLPEPPFGLEANIGVASAKELGRKPKEAA